MELIAAHCDGTDKKGADTPAANVQADGVPSGSIAKQSSGPATSTAPLSATAPASATSSSPPAAVRPAPSVPVNSAPFNALAAQVSQPATGAQAGRIGSAGSRAAGWTKSAWSVSAGYASQCQRAWCAAIAWHARSTDRADDGSDAWNATGRRIHTAIWTAARVYASVWHTGADARRTTGHSGAADGSRSGWLRRSLRRRGQQFVSSPG